MAEMLMHHSDSGADRFCGRRDHARPSGGCHLSRVRSRQAERNAHQRGFACTVFSDERVDGPTPYAKRHVVERDGLSEPLADTSERKHGVGF
jgi:hypothetical protein